MLLMAFYAHVSLYFTIPPPPPPASLILCPSISLDLFLVTVVPSSAFIPHVC